MRRLLGHERHVVLEELLASTEGVLQLGDVTLRQAAALLERMHPASRPMRISGEAAAHWLAQRRQERQAAVETLFTMSLWESRG